MYRQTQIYVDQLHGATSEQIHVPAMGICEIMPSGVIRHGGEGTKYPSLIMVFHDQAWSLSPNGSEWLPAKHRLIIWEYEARHVYGNPSRKWNHSWLRVTGRWIDRTLRGTMVPLGVPYRYSRRCSATPLFADDQRRATQQSSSGSRYARGAATAFLARYRTPRQHGSCFSPPRSALRARTQIYRDPLRPAFQPG